MKLDFYYFSFQCPLNDDMIHLLDEYKDKIEVHLHDFSTDRSTAAEWRIFYPTLTVLDDEKRYYSPLTRSFLDQAACGKYPNELPFLPPISQKAVELIVSPLKLDTIATACECCGSKSASNCQSKRRFLEKYGLDIYGFIHQDTSGNLIGGAEYLPSEFVPYPIPHNRDTAFITCVYLSDSEQDYKSAPLRALENYLAKTFTMVIAISDEIGVFPNGDLRFFIRNGYKDEGIVFEDSSYCKLHLVSKIL